MIPTLFGVMLLTFVVTQFVPGGPVEQLLSQMEGLGKGGEVSAGPSFYHGDSGLDESRVEQLKELYGFDKPPVTRFISMMKNYLVFDFGTSYYYHQSVVDLVISRMPVSMSLGLWSFLIVYGVYLSSNIIGLYRQVSAKSSIY